MISSLCPHLAHKWEKPKCQQKGGWIVISVLLPPGLLLAGFSPPLLLSEQGGGRGTSVLVDWLLITSPSSVSHLVNSYPSHFVSSVNQDWSLKVWYLDSLHDLSVQRLVVCSRHPHHVDHVLPAVMMLHWVGPQDGLFLVLGGLVVQVLLTSAEAIPTRLSFVGRHLDPTLLTPQEVCNRLTPTVATSSRIALEAFWTLTTLSSPQVWSS